MTEHAIELPVAPEAALSAVREAAEAWGAELRLEGSEGTLHLPILVGLRRGLVSGPLTVQPAAAGGTDSGSRIVFHEEERHETVQAPAVAILLLAVAGGLLTVAWPFYPKLLPVAPFGAILALGGWFLVVSRLRNSGPDEFLKAVSMVAEGEDS